MTKRKEAEGPIIIEGPKAPREEVRKYALRWFPIRRGDKILVDGHLVDPEEFFASLEEENSQQNPLSSPKSSLT